MLAKHYRVFLYVSADAGLKSLLRFAWPLIDDRDNSGPPLQFLSVANKHKTHQHQEHNF